MRRGKGRFRPASPALGLGRELAQETGHAFNLLRRLTAAGAAPLSGPCAQGDRKGHAASAQVR
jgi:hypothetical protein